MSGHKIIIAGGGTGGHVFPALAIGRALERNEPGIALLFVGAKGKMEMEKVPEAGYQIRGLDIVGMDRSSWLKNLGLPFKLYRSYREARKIIREFRPDAAVGVGGYASFPVLRAAQRAGIPTVIQEQNSYAGKSNRILGKRARRICVAFPGMARFFPADRIVETGNPVRESITRTRTGTAEARQAFGLDPGKATLFAVGGSLGARSINQALEAGLDRLQAHGIQLLWQTGQLSYDAVRETVKGREAFVRAHAFIKDMEAAYAAADVVVSRAGSTIAELCVAAKPVIFVPYPYAAEDHQTRNALSLVERGAAEMIPDAEARERLVTEAIALLEDPARRRDLVERIRPLAIPDADDRIAREILKVMKG